MEVKDFNNIVNILGKISECPNFPDGMRNNASGLAFYIKNYIPEPAEPLIVKSGETWVAHWEGVDYLCTADMPGLRPVFEPKYKGINNWQSFTGPNPDIVELTDDIACLRPIIKHAAGDQISYEKLIYVDRNSLDRLSYYTPSGSFNVCRLAKAKDLQEMIR